MPTRHSKRQTTADHDYDLNLMVVCRLPRSINLSQLSMLRMILSQDLGLDQGYWIRLRHHWTNILKIESGRCRKYRRSQTLWKLCRRTSLGWLIVCYCPCKFKWWWGLVTRAGHHFTRFTSICRNQRYWVRLIVGAKPPEDATGMRSELSDTQACALAYFHSV